MRLKWVEGLVSCTYVDRDKIIIGQIVKVSTGNQWNAYDFSTLGVLDTPRHIGSGSKQHCKRLIEEIWNDKHGNDEKESGSAA